MKRSLIPKKILLILDFGLISSEMKSCRFWWEVNCFCDIAVKKKLKQITNLLTLGTALGREIENSISYHTNVLVRPVDVVNHDNLWYC